MNELQRKYGDKIEELSTASKRLAALGFVSSHGGNLSSRVDEQAVLVTPTKVCKSRVEFDDVCVVDLAGRTLFASPGREPTGETPFHLRIFGARPDIRGVIHAHPPVATGFAIAHSDLLSRPWLPEPITEVGPVVSLDYAEPISEELACTFDAALPRANAFLMRNHGVVLCSVDTVGRALELLEMIEAMAESVLVARTLGIHNELSPEDVDRLENTMRTRDLPMPGLPGAIRRLRDAYWPETDTA